MVLHNPISEIYHIDHLKIPFSVQIDLLAAVRYQRGVNEGATGTQGGAIGMIPEQS